MEVIDRKDLIKWDIKDTRGHGRKFKKDSYRSNMKMNRFPHRVVNVWNGLDSK